jgi:hypothetical protein
VPRKRNTLRTRERLVCTMALAGYPEQEIIESVELSSRRVRRLLRVLGVESTPVPPSTPTWNLPATSVRAGGYKSHDTFSTTSKPD